MMFWLTNGLVFFLLRLPSLFEPYWYGDEGIYLTLGQALRRGLTLYSQIYDNKPPLLYYLAALGRTIFGFRLLLFLVMIPTVIYFYLLARKFFNHRLAAVSTFIFIIFTSIPLTEGNVANAEIFMLLPTILAVYQWLNKKYFWSGVFFGLAFTLKAPVVIEAFFIFICLILTQPAGQRRNILFYLIGCSWPIILWTIYFFFKGAVKPFITAAIFQNFGYLSSWQTGSINHSPLNGGLTGRLLILLLVWGGLYWLLKKKLISSKLVFLLGWLSACIFGSLLSGRPYPHYLIQILPPLFLLIGFWPYFILALSIIICLIFRYKFYFYPTIPYYRNFYFNHNNPSYYGEKVATTYKIAEYLKNNTNRAEPIFIWGDEPYIYALADRLPVGRYTAAYHIIDLNAYEETIMALQQRRPKFIVYFSMENRDFPQLDKFLNQNYLPLDQIGPALIFQLK